MKMPKIPSSATFVSLLMTAPISATTVPTTHPPSAEIERLTIVGQKIARTEQESADSVAVFRQQDVDKLPSFELGDLLQRVPGVQRDNYGFHIRGISQAGAGTGAGNAETISTRIDGAVISGTGNWYGPFSMWDLDQIAVYRGPQSTSQGQNALAGAIVIESAMPEFIKTAKFRSGLGNNGQQVYSAMLNTPLPNDNWAIRLSYDQQQSDGAVHNPTRHSDDAAANNHRTARVALRYSPISALDIQLRLTHTNNRDGVNRVDRAAWEQNHRRIDYSNGRHYWRNRVNIADLRIHYDLNANWQWFAEANYSEQRLRRLTDSDYSAADLGHTHSVYAQHASQYEMRFDYESDRLKGTIGGYYYDMSRDYDLNVALATSVYIANIEQLIGYDPTVFSLQDNHYGATNTALFTEWDYRFAEHWKLTAGLRLDHDKRDNNEFITAYTEPALPAAFSGLVPDDQQSIGDNTNTEWLPKLALTYYFSDDISLALSYQEAYRAGGSGTNLGGNPIYNYTFSPEYTRNYELALRSAWLDNELIINANLYAIDWRDQQVQVQGDSNNTLDYDVRNAGKSTVHGAELNINWQASPYLQPYVGIAYNETEFDHFTTMDETGSRRVNLAGNEFPNAPSFTASAGVDVAWQNWFANVQYSYRSSSYVDIYNSDRYRQRGLVNTKLGYDNGQWRISAYARNLFDKDYVLNDATATSLQVGAPRSYGIMAELRY